MQVTKEIVTPLIQEDFAVGDRVYSFFHGDITKGTIVSNRFQSEGNVTITTDEGYCHQVHLSNFIKGPGREYYGRILDMKQLEEGSLISRLKDDGTREYAEILMINHGVDLVKRNCETREGFYYAANEVDLEEQFFDWEIED